MSVSLRICLWITILSSGYVSSEDQPEDLKLFACRFFDGMFNGDCSEAREARESRLANQAELTKATTPKATSLTEIIMSVTSTPETTTIVETPTREATTMAETPTREATTMAETLTPETTTIAETPTPETTTIAETPTPETTTIAETTTPETTTMTETTTPEATTIAETTTPEATTIAETTTQETTTMVETTTPETSTAGVCNQTVCGADYGTCMIYPCYTNGSDCAGINCEMDTYCYKDKCQTENDIYNSISCNIDFYCSRAYKGEPCGSGYCRDKVARCVNGVCRGACEGNGWCSVIEISGTCNSETGLCKITCTTSDDCNGYPCDNGECLINVPACDDDPICLYIG